MQELPSSVGIALCRCVVRVADQHVLAKRAGHGQHQFNTMCKQQGNTQTGCRWLRI